MIGLALRKKLIDDSAVTALVGQRIYPQNMPQNPTLPAITFEVYEDKAHDTLEGLAGLFSGKVQIDVYAAEYLQAQAISEEIRLSLQGWSGISLSVEVGGIYYEGTTDGFEPEVKEYRVTSRYLALYRRANPQGLE